MFSFLVQTLFALQGARKGPSSYSSHHLSGAHFPSPPFITVNARPQGDALFASPNLQSKIIDQNEILVWLQERLCLIDEHTIELATRFPKIRTLSIVEQLEPTLDWLQSRVGLSDEKLGELVRRQPTVLDLSVRDVLEPNISWLQKRLELDQESLQRVILRMTPMVGGLAQLLGSNMEENLEPTLTWLQERLSLDDKSLSKLVQSHPYVL